MSRQGKRAEEADDHLVNDPSENNQAPTTVRARTPSLPSSNCVAVSLGEPPAQDLAPLGGPPPALAAGAGGELPRLSPIPTCWCDREGRENHSQLRPEKPCHSTGGRGFDSRHLHRGHFPEIGRCLPRNGEGSCPARRRARPPGRALRHAHAASRLLDVLGVRVLGVAVKALDVGPTVPGRLPALEAQYSSWAYVMCLPASSWTVSCWQNVVGASGSTASPTPFVAGLVRRLWSPTLGDTVDQTVLGGPVPPSGRHVSVRRRPSRDLRSATGAASSVGEGVTFDPVIACVERGA